MARGLFVTGTDTGVGKTVVSAALMTLCRLRGPVRYWKPVQTGIEHDNDTEQVARLAACAPEEIVDAGIRLPKPVSPHLAAQLAGAAIDVNGIVAIGRAALPFDSYSGRPDERREASAKSIENFWIVEGAGGVLVPLNDRETIADLMVRLALPVVVVARTTLGTINHTLLTLEALRHRDLAVACVVMSGEPAPASAQAIAQHGAVAVVGLPLLAPLDAASLRSWASTDGASWPI